MRISEIIQLAKFGYTKEEIKALGEEEKAALSAPPAQTDPAEPPMNSDPPANVPNVPAPHAQDMSAVIAAINSLKETIQASNITDSNRGGTPPETVEDILAKVINSNEKE